MIKILIVAGTWSNVKEKIKNVQDDEDVQEFVDLVRKFSLERTDDITVDINTGGFFGQLEALADSTIDYDVVFWFPEIIKEGVDGKETEIFPASKHVLFRSNVFSNEEVKALIKMATDHKFLKES